MAMTLKDMKEGMSNKVAQQVVDVFLRNSEILQLLNFDNCVSPQGGSTLTYTYMQKKLPSIATFRALNTEYTANEATLEQKSADLKIFGGKFSMDRVLKQAEGKYNNMAFQMEEKIKSAISLLHYTLINGDATTDTEEFDGLDKLLAGTTTEFNTDSVLDISDIGKLKENADQFYESLQVLIRTTSADALLMNTSMITKIQTVARILGYKTESEEAFGKKVTTMDGVRLMDLGNHYTVNDGAAVANSVVKAGLSRELGGTNVDGLTDIYAVKFDVNDGFHAASLTGDSAITQYIPNFKDPGAVKDGEVEMVAATVLKNTQHAGVLRNVKIV
ncbi:major capsid protein [Emergencia sp. 1XD21-10]|uniref:major capsid protein n=1 Tax=Emergencia sp. 1XD21-10 TaxID=2304569 RepID=UPI001379F93E|nr:phage capsid protein [Emergencia sp. 1XD21-10]NCE98407.1 phage capsid protein [Emergencia sp. 1XD21-10]